MSRFKLSRRAPCPGRIAASFSNPGDARRAADCVVDEIGLGRDRVQVVDPREPLSAPALHADANGIGRTLLRRHLVFALCGMVLGLAVFALAQPLPAGSGLSTAVLGFALAGLGSAIGLLAAGLFSVRGGLGPVGRKVRDAGRDGHWVVVALTPDCERGRHARRVLARFADEAAHAA
jgi:hypothetical protein